MAEQLARVIRQCALPMTSQALADLALKADQDRRAALRAGKHDEARVLSDEVAALADLLENHHG